MNNRRSNGRNQGSSQAHTQKGELSHKARKRFGQNFLHDAGIIESIVRSIRPQADDCLVEIGPGKGAITEGLIDDCHSLHVVELDRDLIPWLVIKFERHPQFNIHQADALKFDFESIMEDDKPLRIVGNLPYNISTPLIFHLLSYHERVQDMHFMLQKEVVKRMAAQASEKAYGRLGIMVQYFCKVEHLFDVPPECFDPAPKVDSAIVRLIPYDKLPYPADDYKIFDRLVNTAFQQRRKTLRNTLKQLLTVEQIEQLTIDTSVRPENLSMQEFVELSNTIGPMLDHAE
tara:strand:- start:238 stop:1101 length:864 start_codon:yes stop_codon:yes gene_type:complete